MVFLCQLKSELLFTPPQKIETPGDGDETVNLMCFTPSKESDAGDTTTPSRRRYVIYIGTSSRSYCILFDLLSQFRKSSMYVFVQYIVNATAYSNVLPFPISEVPGNRLGFLFYE